MTTEEESLLCMVMLSVEVSWVIWLQVPVLPCLLIFTVGDYRCINQDGNFSYGKGTWKKGAGGRHANGDVVGCGLLIPKSGGRSIFFTKNGG
jgi:hypothetical protein